MTDPRTPDNPTTDRPILSTRSFKILSVITFLILVALFVLNWQADYFNEVYNLNPGIPSVITSLFVPLLIIGWSVWCFFIARMRLVGLVILLAPAVFLVLFYPNFSGDAKIDGWKARFWKSDVQFAELTNNANAVDLSTTTPLDFPQFLGPDRNAQIGDIELKDDWESNPPQLLWKQPIGEGWSGFAAVNGFAITQEQRGENECVTCYQIDTGKLEWIHQTLRRHEDLMAMGKVGPRATPTIDQGRVYVTSGTGVLDCLSGVDGSLVWSANVPQLVGIAQLPHRNSLGIDYTMEDSSLMWGRACSPLIYEDQVIVTAGGDLAGASSPVTLISFDKLSGNELWRGGNRMVAYGSPSLATVLGRPQILLVAESDAVGHDPDTGEEIWNHPREGSSNSNANCSQITPVSETQLLLSKGYNLGGELIKLSETGGKIAVQSLHKNHRVLKTKLTNPVIFEGHAYSLSDGFLECTQVETFKRKWKERGQVRFGNGQLLLVGNRLLVHTEGGTLVLAAADPTEYRELGSIKTIQGLCWNTLCLYGDRLLVRSEQEAACYRLPTQ